MKLRSVGLSLLASCLLVLPELGAQTPPPSVRVVVPKQAASAAAYTIPGRTEPIEAARLFTRATGIVHEKNYDIGDQVKRGDVLAVVSVPDLDRAVEAARAGVEQAEVRAANARTLADRPNSLLTARAISQEDSDSRTAEAAATAAAVRVAQADLARLEEQQKFARVRAPFDGVIAARNFDRGDRVRGDSATAEGWLYHLVRLDELRFTVFATPDLALRLAPGTAAEVSFREFPGKVHVAKVARSSRVFDPAAGTMRVELLLENRDLALPAGVTGNATFTLPPGMDTFLVPTNTLLSQAGKSRVAAVRDGKVAFIEVTLGRNLGSQVEVTSTGLTLETQIIVNPNGMLRAGEQVTLAELPRA